MFKDGEIDGLIVKPLKVFTDERGWLAETFREDEIEKKLLPAMSYVSVTKPGQARGPHEHLCQTDYFSFAGPGTFLFLAWDNRKKSPTFNNRQHILVGGQNRASVIVPPGIVHGYANIGSNEGMVINYPNRLFAGQNKKERVDEVRHEDDTNSPFVIDFGEFFTLHTSETSLQDTSGKCSE